MKLAIVGSRDFLDWDLLCENINPKNITEIVSGGARGADALAERYAREVLGIEPTVFKADWKKYGNAAGIMRNTPLIQYSDAVVAFWDGKSPGTKDAISKAKRFKKQLKIVYF